MDIRLDDSDIVYLEDILVDENSDRESTAKKAQKQDEDEDSSLEWPAIHFGGDLSSLVHDDPYPVLLFLHRIPLTNVSPIARSVSNPIIGCTNHKGTGDAAANGTDSCDSTGAGIYMTTYQGAKRMIRAGEATADDFFVTVGYCGWDLGQLSHEIDRGTWVSVSADPDTIWNDVMQQTNSAKETTSTSSSLSSPDPRKAGLDVWDLIRQKLNPRFKTESVIAGSEMNDDDKLQRTNESNKKPSFSDLMLIEWCTQMLYLEKEIGVGKMFQEECSTETKMERGSSTAKEVTDFVVSDRMFQRLPMVGSLVRASASPSTSMAAFNDDDINDGTPPFILNNAFLHKSVLLMIHDSDEASIALTLNLPTTRMVALYTPNGQEIEFPIRYGGPSTGMVEDDQEDGDGDDCGSSSITVLWLHSSPTLQRLDVGAPLIDQEQLMKNDSDEEFDFDEILKEYQSSKFWTCSPEQVAVAIDEGWAKPSEFMVVEGFTVFPKETVDAGDGRAAGGLVAHVRAGYFETIPMEQVENVWSLLLTQESLKDRTLQPNIEIGQAAWTICDLPGGHDSDGRNAIGRKAEHNNVLKDRKVYGTNVTVSELADEAHKNWIKVFLGDDVEYMPM